jgi:hypothetical protein
MKDRILRGWTPVRWLYLILGVITIIQSALVQEWVGILFGSYFASMGLFAFGCAAGQCNIPIRNHKIYEEKNIQYTEIQ